jgi:hypothetical protein
LSAEDVPLNLANRMFGEGLVNLSDDVVLHIGVKCMPQLHECAWRRSYNHRSDIVCADQLFHRGGNTSRKTLLLQFTPCCCDDSSSHVESASARLMARVAKSLTKINVRDGRDQQFGIEGRKPSSRER